MRVVLALDKFKSTFTALQVNELIAEGIRAGNPKIEIIMRPMADGGDGTAALLAEAMGLEAMRVEVPDLLGRIIDTQIYWQNTRRVVIIDAAEILGISRAVGQKNVVQNATSVGLARLVQHALKLCPREIWIGIGGTFTADAGWGFAHAFGLEAFNESHELIAPKLENMAHIREMKIPGASGQLLKTKITAFCDVNAPATGAPVSLVSFLAQKGASKETFFDIEKSIVTFAQQLRAINSKVPHHTDAFTGCGGALCLGMSAVIPHFHMVQGAQMVAQMTALRSSVRKSNLVVCGEGCFDEQTFYGKAPQIVSQIALEEKVPVVGVFGRARFSPSSAIDIQIAQSKLNLNHAYVLFPDEKITSTFELMRHSRIKLFELGLDLARRIESKND